MSGRDKRVCGTGMPCIGAARTSECVYNTSVYDTCVYNTRVYSTCVCVSVNRPPRATVTSQLARVRYKLDA